MSSVSLPAFMPSPPPAGPPTAPAFPAESVTGPAASRAGSAASALGGASYDAAPRPAADAPALPPALERTEKGRVRDASLTGGIKTAGVFIHLWPIFLGVIGPFALAMPLAIWLVGRSDRPFLDDHGREALDFQISIALVTIVLAITVVGSILIPVWLVAAFVFTIRAAIAAGNGEYHRYPMTIRLFNNG